VAGEHKKIDDNLTGLLLGPAPAARYLRKYLAKGETMRRSFPVLSALAGILWVLCPTDGAAVRDRSRSFAWVTLQGRVVWGGKTIPARRQLRVIRDQEYFRRFEPIWDEKCVVNPRGRGVRWVFVWLDSGGKKSLSVHPELRRVQEKTVRMTIARGRFEPHALALRQGQSVEVRNTGPVCFNLNWWGRTLRGRGLNGNVVVAARRSYTIQGLKHSRFPVVLRDNIHPWMGAWLRAFDHPYFAVTDREGRFTIPKAPAGSHRLVVWQETTGWGPGRARGIVVTLGGSPRSVVKVVLKP
jgi:hypothetical protein